MAMLNLLYVIPLHCVVQAKAAGRSPQGRRREFWAGKTIISLGTVHSIPLNSGKTPVLPVLPTAAPLAHRKQGGPFHDKIFHTSVKHGEQKNMFGNNSSKVLR